MNNWFTLMSDDYKRPDPDLLLQSMKEDDSKEDKRGKLKIFFGMAAGVGKTYTMLEAAQRRSLEGIKIVIGYIETHGRVETDNLVKGLEIIPRKNIDCHGMTVEEFDIDTVLDRKPEIVLVDELAHTNAEGSRHIKRYQDVLELLANGISVYTTLNVQHLESQADVVEKITGVRIKETLSDSIMDLANEVELIDIPPDELLKRLSEGKVYMPEKAGLAAERFFRKGNITALREMALHYTARLVNYELRDYTRKKQIAGPWKSGERLLVAVSPSPYSEYLIRWTRRMAFNLNVSWVAVYIEKQKTLTEAEKKMLTRNLNLARELGAEVVSSADENIVSGLLRVALLKNITQIVVGKPLRRQIADYFSGGNLVERLLKSSGDFEIHVVTQPDVHGKKLGVSGTILSFSSHFNEYLFGVGIVAGITLICFFLAPFTGYWTIALVYLFCVVMLSLYISRGPVIFSAALSAVAWNFLFIPPLFTIRIYKVEDALMFGMYFIIAIILGSLTSKLRLKERALRVRENRISNLYEFSKTLGNALGIDEVIATVIKYIEEYFDANIAIILSDDSGRLSAKPHKSSSLSLSAKDHAIAEWSFKNRVPAGLFTYTLPHSDAYYSPLIAPGRVVGVMALSPKTYTGFSLDQEDFLQNISSQLSMRIERESLSNENQKALVSTESERLYKILLNSISHELRTPLTTITGASSGMLDDAIDNRPETRRALAAEIKNASERLNRLVDNLLDMSRLESGMLRLQQELNDAGDLVSVVIRRLDNELIAHRVHVDIQDNIPMVRMDFTLMEQALTNLVHNAIVHTPPDTLITVSVSKINNAVTLAVKDNGPGLVNEEIPYLFDKFRRGSTAKTGGTGLGLSICKGIVEAHGGAVSARNNPEGGAVFSITLPLSAAGEKINGDSS